MASSIAMSTPSISRSGVTRPALSQLAITHTVRSRSIWHCARDNYSNREKPERSYRRAGNYHRHLQAKCRRRTESHQDWPSTSPAWGWSLGQSRSSFSDFLAGREKSFWETEREQMEQRIASLREHIAKNPFGAIFGRRLDPFFTDSKDGNGFSGFAPSSVKDDPTGTTQSTKAHLQDFNFAKSPQANKGASDMLQYDPISGRMAPKPPRPSDIADAVQPSSASVDCPPGSEVEAKFVSNPTLVEDGQFQPGRVPIRQGSGTKVNSDTLDCPPGSELETLFATDPASYKDTKVPNNRDVSVKPNVNIDCPPGNELESLFISESARSEQPHAETSNVQGLTKQRDADAGLASGVNVECSPGSELEAMFVAKPTSRNEQDRPLNTFDSPPTSQHTDMTVDCPPGNELDAKFAAESGGVGSQTESVSSTGQDVGANIDCAPGSELEAKILSESATCSLEQPSTQKTVECPPGNELEAKFTADPASAEDGQFKPTLAAEAINAKHADVTVDCAPGNELEALFKTDAASSAHLEGREDLGALSASDIRARYTSPSDKRHEVSSSDTLTFDGPEDRVGDFLRHQATANKSEAWSSADYRILAYDSSMSIVKTSEADSFFGMNETVQAHEILARLHNPAKFVPYFEQMQKDGYEIATGGGDILVFRKSSGMSTQSASNTTTTESETVNHTANAEIAKFIRHDSFDTPTSTSPSFTSKVSRQ